MSVSHSTIESPGDEVNSCRGDAVKQIKSVRNACTLLEAIADRQPVGVSELGRVTGIDKSAVQRLVVTLHDAGWLRPSPEPPTRWQISPGNRVLRHAAMPGLASLVQPAAERLRDQSGETVIFVTENDGVFVVVAAAESRHAVRVSVPVGFVLPPSGSSSAAAIAAHLPEAELRAVRRACPSLDDTALSEVRRRGWAEVDGEVGSGSRAVAAPLLGTDGYPVGALTVTGPVSRIGRRDLPRLGEMAAGTAEAARRELGS